MAYSPQNKLQAYGKAEAQGALVHRRYTVLLSGNASLIHGINLTERKATHNRCSTGKQHSHIQVEQQKL